MLLQKATEDLCARLHKDEIWNANTSHVALSPSQHWDYGLLEMSTPRPPRDTLLNLANAQEPFAYQLKSNTSTEECHCQPATHTALVWNLSTAFQITWELRAGFLPSNKPSLHRRCHPGTAST